MSGGSGSTDLRRSEVELAQAILREGFPNHRIIGIENAREILSGGGSVACIAKPQYAGSAK
jgi:agmatine deiminase